MAQSLSQLIVSSDHAVPLDALGGSAVLSVASGGPVYYADNRQVSAAANQGSVSAGASQTFSTQQWLIGTAGSPASCTLVYGTPPSDIGIGSGDNLSFVQPSPGVGQLYQGTVGSFGVPDTTLNPALKVSRSLSQPYSASVVGDGAEQLAAIVAATRGDANTQVQMVGVLGQVENLGTTIGASDSPDACGIYGYGLVAGSGVGVGIGGNFRGQANTAGGRLTAAQFLTYNNTGANFTPSSTGFSGAVGILITDGNPAFSSACGIEFDNAFGQQFHTGIHANAHVAGALTGGIATNFILDESSATNSLHIKGAHTYALLVESGGGKAVIGAPSGAFASALLEVRQPTTTTDDPLVVISGDTVSSNVSLQVRNGTGGMKMFAAGSTGIFITGSNAGDTGLQALTLGKRMLFGGSTIVMSITNANTLGYFGVTEVVQQSAVGTATGYAAGATAVTFHSDDTYTGNTGSTAYTINGVVSALKKYGLLAS